MLRNTLRRCIGVAAIGGAAALSAAAQSATPSPVALASTVRAPSRPTTVLVHGLDSSKETWSGVLADLTKAGYPALALDLRGHGESPLGDPASFSPTALANDVIVAARAHGVENGAVLVGHSMGGRVAMRVAALDGMSDAPLFSSVVIEDMDLRVRARAAACLSAEQAEEISAFEAEAGRRFPDWSSARAALLRWYDGDSARVDGWKGSRVRTLPGERGVWSDLNPAAQRLARDRILASSDGAAAWDGLNGLPTKVHLWYADNPGTVCEVKGPAGIEDMATRLPAAKVRFFPGSSHSIHNSAREEFVLALRQVVDDASLASSP